MKKLIILALILVSVFTLSVAACESEYLHADFTNDALIEDYISTVKAGTYFHTENAYFVTIVDGYEMHQTIDGLLIKGTECICGDIAGILSVDEIVLNYEILLNKGEYFTTDASQHTVSINGVNCHQKMDGTFVYDGNVLLSDITSVTGYNVLKEYLGAYFIRRVEAGNYINNNFMPYLVITDTFDLLYVKNGALICNGETIYNCVATMDQENGDIIFQSLGLAVSFDGDFIYTYYFGEIVSVTNIHTGLSPRG